MSVFAAATGLGSWPGSTPREAAEIVIGELSRLPHLVELPDRGVGADLVGRSGALLVDIAIDTVTRGYRIAARPGAVMRRARSLLDEDVDALEEAWEKSGGADRVVKVQAPGPITLAAQLELANGHRAITDPGAVRDLTASLAEGVSRHRAEVARRLSTTVVVQFDEPLLTVALAGRLTGVTALNTVHPVDEVRAITLLDECVTAVGGEVLLHCCSAEIPWNLLRRSMISAVSFDVATLVADDLDGLGEYVDSGRSVVLGLVPALAPATNTIAVEELAAAAVAVTDRLGFPRALLRDRIGISPACGLAGATPAWARTAIGLTQRVAEVMADEPESV
ncbi:MAG: methionine synthase [Mycobacterium sp.]